MTTNWTEYTGTDEQIAELAQARSPEGSGFITSPCGVRYNNQVVPNGYVLAKVMDTTTHYWIIPDDPLREMKIRQA